MLKILGLDELNTHTLFLGKDGVHLNRAWHDEGRIADTLGEDLLWNTLGKIHICKICVKICRH